MQYCHSQHTDSQHCKTVDDHTKVPVFASTFFGKTYSAPGERKSKCILETVAFSHATAHIHDCSWCRSKCVASPFRMVTPWTDGGDDVQPDDAEPDDD
jgi:hypothetical protein